MQRRTFISTIATAAVASTCPAVTASEEIITGFIAPNYKTVLKSVIIPKSALKQLGLNTPEFLKLADVTCYFTYDTWRVMKAPIVKKAVKGTEYERIFNLPPAAAKRYSENEEDVHLFSNPVALKPLYAARCQQPPHALLDAWWTQQCVAL